MYVHYRTVCGAVLEVGRKVEVRGLVLIRRQLKEGRGAGQAGWAGAGLH